MHPRTVGRPPRRTPVHPRFAFHSNAVQERRLNRAFTLIELLVVIAIIAILIGLLFPAFQAVQNQAKQTQAKNDLTQIVNAVNAFYTEYGKYPPATDDVVIADNSTLFNVLRAMDPTNNPRQIVFINPPYVKNDTAGQRRAGVSPTDGKYYDPWVKNTASPRAGIQSTGTNIGIYYDPWGTPYQVAVDTSYDNQMTNPYTADTGAGAATLGQGVIAWSLGKDATQGTNFNVSDDVLSWQ